ncbi:hypothetical protein GUITHDRAFT_153038 [Guillardia theta CCMP2712]|uniref:Peroxin-7 n=1 Tax=Guillardia theta (strain CCMP2712) TaxID=905079 RepID=L1J6T6_GUITC|nr:hypothetical protein GUITHDRAFT_153038 [Guillardia theta CCMP2712]EKX44057.1 hypothetical protein GUITHDRAFT_153038 [Guillardia theta CCMP2712]|eukprot:XP_005831037.1 hypothetical protein GUITHDRAFT_153038 [Guillardia theta CCMP2712]
MECPITYSFYPHMGPVHSVAFSPLLRNLFASCAADGIIRVHSSLQAAPLLLLEPSVLSIYCVAWSPMKPLVLAAGGSGGLVFLYDLTVDPSNPVQTMRASPRVARAGGAGGEGWEVESEEREAGSNVNALLFQESGSLLAAGCWSGETHVWRLRNELCEQVPEDGEAAKKLLG